MSKKLPLALDKQIKG